MAALSLWIAMYHVLRSSFSGCDIVFFKGKSFSEGLPFCNFVRNKIYVIRLELIQVAILARYMQSA